MNDVAIDANGEFRCWNCGHGDFRWRRTGKDRLWNSLSWILPGVQGGRHKKLKCQVCGEFNHFIRPLVVPAGPGASPETTSRSVAAWQPDPSDRHELRYWDGDAWTDHVSDAGVVSTDPASRRTSSG